MKQSIINIMKFNIFNIISKRNVFYLPNLVKNIQNIRKHVDAQFGNDGKFHRKILSGKKAFGT